MVPVLNDEPLEGSEEWNDGVGWPQNVSRTYKGHMNVDDAIMISQKRPGCLACGGFDYPRPATNGLRKSSTLPP